MNVKFLNPFVEGAYEVLCSETGQTVKRGDLRLENDIYQTDDLTVIISLVGAVVGTVFYSMPQEVAIKLASILLGDDLSELDNLAQSGIAELGNVITGRASTKLSKAGFECNISTPSLIMGNGASISTLDCPRLVVPLETVAGKLDIHLALRQGNDNGLKAPQMAIPSAFQTTG